MNSIFALAYMPINQSKHPLFFQEVGPSVRYVPKVEAEEAEQDYEESVHSDERDDNWCLHNAYSSAVRIWDCFLEVLNLLIGLALTPHIICSKLLNLLLGLLVRPKRLNTNSDHNEDEDVDEDSSDKWPLESLSYMEPMFVGVLGAPLDDVEQGVQLRDYCHDFSKGVPLLVDSRLHKIAHCAEQSEHEEEEQCLHTAVKGHATAAFLFLLLLLIDHHHLSIRLHLIL